MIKFEPVIGLEVHAQISTKSKMFCRCSNDSFGKEANTNVCPICMGFPGMLPVINREALQKGVIAALALHCEIPEFSKFDRKNYFYPDLPKGFQISQYDKPISKNGYVDILVNGRKKRIRINRLHLEDDAGKLTHVSDGTLCDYNRSGSPLMEVVTEPDLRSVEEASVYAEELQRILRYVGASECDMEKGMMRFDANISLREIGEEKYGIRAEVKNLNSFKALRDALVYEIARQEEVLLALGTITQETRGWDDNKGQTFSQRSKEEAHDYRYFPEPDLPPMTYEPKEVKAFLKMIPELPLGRRLRFMESYGISEADAGILTSERVLADFFDSAVKVSKDPKKTVPFITTILLKHLHSDSTALSQCKVTPKMLGELVLLVSEGKISNNMAKGEIFEEMYKTGKDPQSIIKEKGMAMVSDISAIETICKKILEDNPRAISEFKAGKDTAIGFLVGQVMKESKGQANPKVVNEILQKLLRET